MSKDLKDIDLKAIPEQLLQFGKTLSRYKVVLFFVLLAGVYGFVTWEIYSLSNQKPDSSDVSSQVHILSPHIDQSVVQQLESLQDNSVNAKALFHGSRDNPFSE